MKINLFKYFLASLCFLLIGNHSNAQIVQSYEYDNLNRLIQVTHANGTIITYQYDANGNRTHRQVIPAGTLPEVTTAAASGITAFSALLGGQVVVDGGSGISERGVYWGTAVNPESTGASLSMGSGTGEFSATLHGLSPETTYHIKAYATNDSGTSFGEELTFQTLAEEEPPKFSLTLHINPLEAGSADGSGSYSEGEGVLVAAIANEGWAFINWTGDTGYLENPNAIETMVAMPAGDITLVANFDQETVPHTRPLFGIIITDEEGNVCFDALQTITTGGTGHFIVEPGAVVDLIAGENIIMKPGTHFKQGSQVNAYITTDQTFCGGPDKHFLAAGEKTGTRNDDETETKEPANTPRASFTVYPNPTKDRFTLELHQYDTGSMVMVEIYSMHGQRIKHREVQAGQQHVFSLEGQQPGIYLVRVMQEGQMGVERLIKM